MSGGQRDPPLLIQPFPRRRSYDLLLIACCYETHGVWHRVVIDGERTEANILVSAVGQLPRPAYPTFDVREQFRGRAFPSAHWDHTYDCAGKHVAVIGT